MHVDDDFGAPFIPSPAEIAAGCAEIQATWDAREERSRRMWDIDRRKLRMSPVPTGYVQDAERDSAA